MRDIRLRDKLNSWCLLCGKIWFGRVLAKCPRCGGLCTKRSDRDLAFMARNGMYEVEKGA